MVAQHGADLRLPNSAPMARQLYRAIYHEPWPKGWCVRWQRAIKPDADDSAMFDATAGFTDSAKRLIVLSLRVALVECATDALAHGSQWRVFFDTYPEPWQFGGVFDTLIHEFTHVRHPRLRHGVKFERLVREAKQTLTALPSRTGRHIASASSEVASDDAVCAG